MEKAFGLEIPENLEDACELNRTVLVVYDMQVGIFSQLNNGSEIKTQVVKVLQAAREVGLRVFFMRHMSLPKESSGVFQLKTAKAWQRVTSVDDGVYSLHVAQCLLIDIESCPRREVANQRFPIIFYLELIYRLQRCQILLLFS